MANIQGCGTVELEPVSDKPPPLPSLADYTKFGLPCIGLWISGPLLSLVDTFCIGLNANSAQQVAALGPATTLFDGATFLFGFLNVATTNLYSSARAKAGDQSQETESVVRTAVKISLVLGFGAMLALFAICRPFLRAYIGVQASPDIVEMATDYVKIRSLTLPSVLVFRVLQASLVGAKKPITPLIAILSSVFANVIGDLLLVNKWKFGLVGAAIATSISQFLGIIVLLPYAKRRLFSDGRVFRDMDSATENRASTVTFFKFALPVLILVFGKLSAFGFMTHSAATLPGQPITLASHQIMLSLFMFGTPFFQAISQTAQTFLPTYLQCNNAARRVSVRLLGAGLVAATVVGCLLSLIPSQLPSVITSDKRVQQAVRSLWPHLFISTFLMAPIAVSEGVMLARRDLKFLAVIYVLSTALLIPALLVKFPGRSVEYVWACLSLFQAVRASAFVGRVSLGFFPCESRSQPENKENQRNEDLA